MFVLTQVEFLTLKYVWQFTFYWRSTETNNTPPIKGVSWTKRSPPAPPVIQILVSEVQSYVRYSFSNRAHFWPLDIMWDVLAFLYQVIHHFYSSFRVLKGSKKDKNMLSCTRIYVDPTYTLTGQGRKGILVRNGLNCWSCSMALVILNYPSPLPPINWRVTGW